MYLSGIVLQGWFLLIVLRDFIFIIYEFFFGDQLGFWRALSYHLLSVPIDSFVLLILCSWSAIVMKQEANALKCQQETECQAFLQPHRTNVILGFILVFLNVTAKFFFLAFFFFMLGGMQMLIADMEERDRERNEKASIEAQRRLRTDSFQNIIAELQRSSE
mmetsp:Transcript_21161/g.26100  ORF Transcript_21161/g.26100 Transcript_21161/m.26100 type:complete len:162 (+) Transcript_21161:1092-1577(+)